MLDVRGLGKSYAVRLNSDVEMPKNPDLPTKAPVKPGTPTVYQVTANVNYTILGAIIEKVSGMSYPDYVVRKIFEPAGMDAATSNAIGARRRSAPSVRPAKKYSPDPFALSSASEMSVASLVAPRSTVSAAARAAHAEFAASRSASALAALAPCTVFAAEIIV